jgi:hypothetical protein
MDVKQAIQILSLAAEVEPIAVDMIHDLLKNLQGKTTEEIVAESDAIFDGVIARAHAQGS